MEVIQGDCIEGMGRMPPGEVNLIIADPPYGIGMADWDSWSDEQMLAFLQKAFHILVEGGTLLVWGSPCQTLLCKLIINAVGVGFEHKQLLSWCYTQGGDARTSSMRHYATRHENLAWLIKPGTHKFHALKGASHYSEAEIRTALAKAPGRVSRESLARGRPPRSWFDVPRVNSRSLERAHGHHPCQKPLELCRMLVEVHSDPGDIVVVPFGGSGSEAIAARMAERKVICFEICEEYVGMILARSRSIIT